MKYLTTFVFHYPLLMAFVWIIGSVLYRIRRIPHTGFEPPALKEYPKVSILIPCHNEEECVEEVIERMVKLDYPDFEIIAIDDGSKDATLRILHSLEQKHECVRLIRLKKNRGKAEALKMGLLFSNSEFLVCIDADSYLEKHALGWIMWHFVTFPRVGAVTGNPRVRNRTSLLGKIQVGEYSTIVGMIKRTQRILGKVFTISGVVAGFRKRALLDTGMWSEDMVTDDIDVSWNLQVGFWDIRFEEYALCWILTPESLRGLWIQRLRWAQGGAEVILKYFKKLLAYKQRRFWPVYIEYFVSMVWAYSFFSCVLMYLLGLCIDLPASLQVGDILVPRWTGTLLATVCLLQAGIALLFENKFERGICKYLFWFIWYPVVYWLLSAASSVVGFPKALFKKKGARAIWESPDRGIK